MLDECWEWNGTIQNTGYGAKWIKGKQFHTHRLAYAWANGPIPNGMCVCHKCDNKICVNPGHLFLGTQTDNLQDMCRKGRHWCQQKTHCKNGHKFTAENTKPRKNGKGRVCVTCAKKRSLDHYNKIKLLA